MSDQWAHRSIGMRCRTCMWFVPKAASTPVGANVAVVEAPRVLGRCRRHAPTMNGFPAVFAEDWCGDHKLDENRLP